MVQLLRLTPLLPFAGALSTQQAPTAKRVAIIGAPLSHNLYISP
jgi:hypothetical protein